MTNIDDLKSMYLYDKQRTIFKKFIEYIRFPHYKNFSKDLKVNFSFPITFLVGPNGTGKSSLLQALYGSPGGKSVSDFWFTTAMDPIIELKENRNCFIYGYKTHKTKSNAEVLKLRIKKPNNPEYWEPSRPLKKYKMDDLPVTVDQSEASKTRWNTIDKNIYYLDFRYELSAFDKYFYFGTRPNTKRMKSKQDLIRKYSSKIKNAYDFDRETSMRTRKASKPIKLTNEELKTISSILGKEYISASMLEHDFYEKMKGFSIKYTTDYNMYSEAFAGSGETAIVKLVHDIYNADEYSLILLDEPETSLHPGAQHKLIQFLLEQIKEKKLQVVVSTHSPDIILNMPKEAIKIFCTNPKTNKTEVIENILPQEAFSYIGHNISEKKLIIVEDILAKMILDKVLKKIGGKELFEIKFFPGGESRIKQEFMLVYSKEESKKHFIIFDGDQKVDKVDISLIPDSEKTVDILKNKVKDIIHEDVEFFTDGNSGAGREDQKVKLILSYIKYHKENVFFLPKNIPEEIIWSEDTLNKTDLDMTEKKAILQEKKLKTKFNLFALYMFGNNASEDQNQAYNYFLLRWLKDENDDFNHMKNLLEYIKEK